MGVSVRIGLARTRVIAVLLLVALVLLVASGTAWASGPPYWSAPKSSGISSGGGVGVSCTGQFCAFWSGFGDPGNFQPYVNTSGDLTSASPQYGGGYIGSPGASNRIEDVACLSDQLCLAATQGNGLLTSSDPSSSSPTWTALALPGGSTSGSEPAAVSCPTASLCVASGGPAGGGGGQVWATSDPGGPASGWTDTSLSVSGSDPISLLSCTAAGLCLATTDLGQAFVSTDPGAVSPTWTATTIAGTYGGSPYESIQSISCAGGSLCVAVDSAGNTITDTDAGASGSAWTVRSISADRLDGVSCSSVSQCVATGVDNSSGAAEILQSDDPESSSPSWAVVDTHGAGGVSCSSDQFCVVANDGAPIVGTATPIGAPTATIGSAQADSSTAETVGATVDPNGDPVTSCQFFYTAPGSSGSAVPCTPSPGAGSSPVDVSATLTGLSTGATYQYYVEVQNSYGIVQSQTATFVAGSFGGGGPGGGGGGGGGGQSCAKNLVMLTAVAEAQGCFTASGADYTTTSSMSLNGITFSPGPGGRVTLSPRNQSIEGTGTGVVRIGALPLDTWVGANSFGFSGATERIYLNPSRNLGITLFGFGLAAPIQGQFSAGGATLATHRRL